METGNQAAVVAYHKSRGSLIACDIRNYVDKPGPALSRLIFLEWPRDPDEDCSIEEATRVCCDRCEIILEVCKRLIDWHTDSNLGRLSLTTASVAMTAFKHRGMMHEIELPESQEIRDLQRAAYHGGRTEPLWIGEKRTGVYKPHPLSSYHPGLITEAPIGPFHLLDASSFYGSIYCDHYLPRCLTHYGDGMDSVTARKLITDESWLAECKIESDKEQFPVKTDDGLRYAIGSYVTTLCGPELMRAVQSGSVTKIRQWHKYDLAPILKDYAYFMYRYRLDSRSSNNLVIESWCKQLIAQLHGKFAQRRGQWKVCADIQCDEPWSKFQHWSSSLNRWVQYRAIGYEVQQQQEQDDVADCFPAIPAWVAACGRETLRLWEIIAGFHHTLYVSTDSLLVDDTGYHRLANAGLISDGEIGMLKEVVSSDTVSIRGYGCLQIGDVIITQGIHCAAEDKVFGTISDTKYTGIEYAINNMGTAVVRMTSREITPSWNYDPARVDDDGWLTPYHLTEGYEQWEKYRKKKLG